MDAERPALDRRDFFRAAARGLAFAGLAAGAVLLARRNGTQDCALDQACAACGLRRDCALPRARAARDDERRRTR